MKKILILYGGISKERSISLETGRQVAKELKKKYLIKLCEPKDISLSVDLFKPDIIFVDYLTQSLILKVIINIIFGTSIHRQQMSFLLQLMEFPCNQQLINFLIKPQNLHIFQVLRCP